MTCTLHTAQEIQAPRLILNFDVNQTLILKDTAKNAGMEYFLRSILAEQTMDYWDESYERMSFKNYVEKVLLPGDKSNKELKKAREAQIFGFLDWLKIHEHPAEKRVFEEYNEFKARAHEEVFESFYKLISKLKEQNIQFLVVIRTFGNDIEEITSKISQRDPSIEFKKGKFTDKTLSIEEEDSIGEIKKIFERIVNSATHLAIQDNWNEWNQDQGRARSGKPFFYDASNPLYLSLFFDDNLDYDPEKDIIAPILIDGSLQSTVDLKDSLLFQADPREALFNEDYYIKKVNQALINQGHKIQIKI